MAGPIRISILADARQATKTVSTFGDKVDRGARRATVGLVALAAGAAGATLAAEKVASSNARVGNVLTNMGMGHATARTLKYAESLEKTLGVDENVIKTTQAKLGTFEAVAKTADKTGGAFDRATLAAVDLAATGFGEAESNAVQLGKALQDPVKGVSALTRVGVSFTAAEKEKIKTLVESGKASKAQEVILAAVEKQVGGTAAATADSSAKIALGFQNIAESIGSLLLPLLNQAAPVIEQMTGVFERNPGVILAVVGAVAALATGIIVLNAVMKAANAIQAISAALHLKTAAGYVASKVALVATTIATKAAAAGQWLLNAAMTANPIGIVIVLVAALVAGLVWFFTQTKIGRKIVAGAWAGIQAAIRAVVSWWQGTALPVIRAVWASIQAAFQQGKAKVGAFLNGILTVIKMVWKYSPLGIIISNWGRIIAWVKGIPGRVASALGSLAGKLVSAGMSIINGFLNGLRAGFERVKSFVGGIGSWIAANKGPRAYDLKLLVKNGGWIMQGLRDGIEGDIPKLRKTLGAVAGAVSGTDLGNLDAPGVTAARRLRSLIGARGADAGSTAQLVEVLFRFEKTGDPLMDAIIDLLRKFVKVNGAGSVQRAFGT